MCCYKNKIWFIYGHAVDIYRMFAHIIDRRYRTVMTTDYIYIYIYTFLFFNFIMHDDFSHLCHRVLYYIILYYIIYLLLLLFVFQIPSNIEMGYRIILDMCIAIVYIGMAGRTQHIFVTVIWHPISSKVLFTCTMPQTG